MARTTVRSEEVEGWEPLVRAVDRAGRPREECQRTRGIGMGRLVVLAIGVALVLLLVVTLDQLLDQALAGVGTGVDQP